MEQKVQQLEATITSLKVRVFDAEESLRAEREGINGIMQQLVNIAKIKGDETGAVTVDAIMQRVAKLVELEESGASVEIEEITE